MSGIKWGLYRDALCSQDRYWYLGVLRGYAAVLFKSFGSREPIQAHVTYMYACAGCSKCYKSRSELHSGLQKSQWYQYILPSFTKKQEGEYVISVLVNKIHNNSTQNISDYLCVPCMHNYWANSDASYLFRVSIRQDYASDQSSSS